MAQTVANSSQLIWHDEHRRNGNATANGDESKSSHQRSMPHHLHASPIGSSIGSPSNYVTTIRTHDSDVRRMDADQRASSSPPSSAKHRHQRDQRAHSTAAAIGAAKKRIEYPRRPGSTDDYRSPTKWTHFDDSDCEAVDDEDEEEEDEEEETDGGDARGDQEKPGVSSDTETKNLLEADACSPDPEDECDNDDANDIQKSKNYEMSRDQKDYYRRCFLFLMKQTQNTVDLSGALRGADDRVMDFFKKSDLDMDSLSKIWYLTDVNEDGWLNFGEFSTAMHLIVLRVKGGLPIPNRLPSSIRPPVTPVRVESRSPPVTPVSSHVKTPQNWRQFEDEQQQQQTCDQPVIVEEQSIQLDHPVRNFSDLPPILVDNRPMPMKMQQHSAQQKQQQPAPMIRTPIAPASPAFAALATASSFKFTLSPKGPPPKPPPRPINRGHTRSASLDLNTIAVGNLSTSMPSAIGHSLMLPSPITSIPESQPPTIATVDRSMMANSSDVAQNDAQTQTDVEMRLDHELMDFGSQLEDAVKRVMSSTDRKVDWKEKCDQLRRLNAQLDRERARLAQVRLQLELRLQEARNIRP